MTTSNRHPAAPWRNFYGRIKGKAIRPAQQRYLDEDLPRLSPGPVGFDENPTRTPLDYRALFGDAPVWLEIGFGAGEHLAHLAKNHPNVGLIGCEPYLNGVAAALGKLRAVRPKVGPGIVRIHPGDARDLMDVLPQGGLARVYLLYPDPWPKARHHRRRFVTPEHLEPLARAMAPGAELRIATDIPDYVRQTLLEVPRAGFDWLAEGPSDWRTPWDGWLSTRYEQKALREGRVPHYLRFQRR